MELTDGATAIVRGAVDAGCDFFAGYPITPASGILVQMVRELPARGGIAVQAEDEIASIGMCIGAAMSGARVLTATSGPGLSLCSENIGLAIMGEVPLVIVDVQRAGPATGGATTVGQGDVQFVRWCTSGGYPIIALAPSTVAECRSLTRQAFEWAQRFRCPVFVLADKELATTLQTLADDEGGPAHAIDVPIPPAADSRTAVPALAPLGGDAFVRFTGSSHDDRGFLTKDPAKVGALNHRLDAKISARAEELELVTADLEPGAGTLVVSYGVTAGAMREAVRLARAHGKRASALTLHTLWPVPARALGRALEGVARVVVAELNLGDYRREIERLVAGQVPVIGVHRVDGEMIGPDQILAEIP